MEDPDVSQFDLRIAIRQNRWANFFFNILLKRNSGIWQKVVWHCMAQYDK